MRSRQGSSHSIGAPSASADNGDCQGTGTGTGSGDKHACIFKVYDDCRQDALVVQVQQSNLTNLDYTRLQKCDSYNESNAIYVRDASVSYQLTH